jgi:ligand-binding sensor domain-containing protein
MKLQNNIYATIMKRPAFVFRASIFCLCLLLSSCTGQVKTDIPKERQGFAVEQPKLVKSQVTGEGDNVHCGLQDNDGNLWFGTTNEGVYRYDGKSFTNFTKEDGLISNAVFAILQDKSGTIWFGTDNGISCFDGKLFKGVPVQENNADLVSIPSTNNNAPGKLFVTSILEDKSGTLWFATNKGVFCYKENVFVPFLNGAIESNGLDLKTAQCMIQDKKGDIWFTTWTEGVCRYDGRSVISYKPNNEVWFRGLLEDKDGNIWVGRRGLGACRYDGTSFTNISQGGPFDYCAPLSMIQGKNGDIWFATEAADPDKRQSEGGVWRYDGKKFENVSDHDDLAHHAVWSIVEDSSGYLWVGTRSMGLYRYDGKSFTSFAE